MFQSAWRKVSAAVTVLIVFLLVGWFAVGTGAIRLGAQISVSNTSLSGAVYDSSGAAIPGANVTLSSTAQGFIRIPADFVLSHEEVRKMVQELTDQRQPEQQPKRGWLR